MKKLKAKNFIPLPTNETYEIYMQLIVEGRTENYFLQRRLWFLRQKMKASVGDEITFNSYEKIYDSLLDKSLKNLNFCHDLELCITAISGYRKKDIRRISKLTKAMILKNTRFNECFEIANQPFPFPIKLNYK